MEKSFKEYMAAKKEEVEKQLSKVLPSADEYPSEIHEAMRYSVFAGGKRLRPVLVLAAYELFSENRPAYGDALKAACALEMLHTFSLIHDDLPCMDDDDLRRGMPTCHKKFGEAVAVLAGDALCIHAFQIISCIKGGAVAAEIADALGTSGMIGGQVVDILSEGKQVGPDILDYIHYHKTSALIRSSLRCGALIAGSSDEELEKISSFGEKIGLSFQIVDDILDIESTTEQLGKTVGRDENLHKSTYPGRYGLGGAREKARKLIRDAVDSLSGINGDTATLRALAEYIITRVN